MTTQQIADAIQGLSQAQIDELFDILEQRGIIGTRPPSPPPAD